MKPYFEDADVAIYHGDSREILPTLVGMDLILTDPPYGKDVKYTDAYDDSREIYWQWFLPFLQVMTQHSPTTVFTHCNEALKHIVTHDWVGAWVKPSSGGSRVGNSPLIASWEPIFCFGIHSYGTQSRGFPDIFRSPPEIGKANVQGIGRAKWTKGSANYHPCPKPIDLYIALINIFGQGKNLIVDPFMGSGTTLRAAKDLHRKAIGIEVEESYCEIAAKRMQQQVFPEHVMNGA